MWQTLVVGLAALIGVAGTASTLSTRPTQVADAAATDAPATAPIAEALDLRPITGFIREHRGTAVVDSKTGRVRKAPQRAQLANNCQCPFDVSDAIIYDNSANWAANEPDVDPNDPNIIPFRNVGAAKEVRDWFDLPYGTEIRGLRLYMGVDSTTPYEFLVKLYRNDTRRNSVRDLIFEQRVIVDANDPNLYAPNVGSTIGLQFEIALDSADYIQVVEPGVVVDPNNPDPGYFFDIDRDRMADFSLTIAVPAAIPDDPNHPGGGNGGVGPQFGDEGRDCYDSIVVSGRPGASSTYNLAEIDPNDRGITLSGSCTICDPNNFFQFRAVMCGLNVAAPDFCDPNKDFPPSNCDFMGCAVADVANSQRIDPNDPMSPLGPEGDCVIDSTDLTVVLKNFGQPLGACRGDGDTNGDGRVNSTDLVNVLSAFGLDCNKSGFPNRVDPEQGGTVGKGR